MLKIDGKVDSRHVVDIRNGCSLASAIVVNSDGTYSSITYMDNDDMRTWNNICEIDASEEELEAYRKYRKQFKVGDMVKIISGRKMLNEVKVVVKQFTYRVEGTYGHGDTDYLVFEDSTKVQSKHCEIL